MTPTNLTVAFLLSISTGLLAAEDRLVTWPAPAGEKVSTDYQVTVDGRPVDIYQARVNDAPWNDAARGFDAGGPYSFVQFDFSGQVEVTVRSADRPLDKVVVQGQGRSLAPRVVDAHTITLSLDRPEIISIELDGKQRPLYLFANALEEDPPREGAPGVVFFGPGIHRPDGGVVELHSGQTLYLAGGAVVQAAIHAKDAENLRICGRGILCGNGWEWRKGPGHMLRLDNCKNVSIVRPYITQYSKEKTWGSIDGVTFRNINVEGKAGKYAVMLDCAPNHGNFRIKNIAFENFRILEEVLNSQSLRLVLGCWMAKPDSFQITFTP